jgi:anti-sigma28 factor (negative regulator of flagellin synthesis)
MSTRKDAKKMQITDEQMKLAQAQILQKKKLVKEIIEIGLVNQAVADQEMIKQVVADVIAMPDREDRIAELKAKIESGTYSVSAEQIVDAMARRAIADRIE